MKKVLIFLLLFLIPFNINAYQREEVTLNKCVDGDTAWFNLNNEVIKTRFLAINTPESTNKIEEYGKEASEFTCELLKNSTKIEIEYDENSDKLDKYDRHLVWIFVDNELLQQKLVKNGLAEIKYVYGDYKYLDILNESLEIAKKNKVNMWKNNEYLFILFGYEITKEIALFLLLILILCIFSKTTRNKVKNKIKRNINKKINDIF